MVRVGFVLLDWWFPCWAGFGLLLVVSVFWCGLLQHGISGVWGFDLRGLFPGNCSLGFLCGLGVCFGVVLGGGYLVCGVLGLVVFFGF